ncbi:hypothetical protein [Streptosporangium sp. KLBMP 9127]|nr:hypothetical protein [Streptosporangium sp. KLBMP 9127]
MDANGRRRVFVPALSLMIVLSSCSGAESGPARSTPMAATGAASLATSAPAAKVTREQAGQALRRYLMTDDVLRAGGELRMALEIVRDGQTPLSTAAYRSSDLEPTRYTWGEPTLFVPRLDRAPYWFTAVVERREGDETRQALLTLVKEDDEGHWQLSFASLLFPGAELPEIALDAEGYATALATRDERIAISPQLMAPLHATVAEEGAKGFSAALIAPGAHTTGYSSEIAERRRQARHDGLNYDSIFGATSSPVFGLRTRDGGGLVQYALTRTTTLTAKVPSAPWIEVPKAARWAVGDSAAVAKELRLVETHQYASVVPKSDSRRAADVIAFDGAVTRVTGR